MKTTARATCTHPGCHETAFWSFDSRKDAAAHFKYRQGWKCTRHTHPEEVLSATNLERTITLTARPSDKLDPAKHRFWHNGIRLASGFNHSDAHKAYATDFPEGTKLIITARIELPAGPRSGGNQPNRRRMKAKQSAKANKRTAPRPPEQRGTELAVQRVGRRAAWRVAGDRRRHPDCKCDKVFFGLSTYVLHPNAPKGGLPGNVCACGLTWVAYGSGKTWWRKGRTPTV